MVDAPLHDLVIIGGGPAGITSGIYAARKQLSTALLTDIIGGQSMVSEGIENWIGTIKISGANLSQMMYDHLNAYKGDFVEVHENERVTKISRDSGFFKVETSLGNSFISHAVFIASGASRRKLNVPGAKEFEHKGLTYCASCDGPMYSGENVAVIGGGNAGFETSAQLLAYAKSVTLIHRNKTFKADPSTVAQLSKHENMHILAPAETLEIKGDKFVNGIMIKNKETGEISEIPVKGVFVEIGTIPNSDFAKDILDLNESGHIKIDPRTQRTSVEGIWAAGDCTDELYHQNNIAAGDAVKATEDLYSWIATHRTK